MLNGQTNRQFVWAFHQITLQSNRGSSKKYGKKGKTAAQTATKE